jgi:beta-glucanase (GH16 family)
VSRIQQLRKNQSAPLHQGRVLLTIGAAGAALLASTILTLPVAGAAKPAAQSTKSAATSSTAPNCGRVAPLGMTGTWRCTFDDEFTGTSLNTKNWVVQQTSNSGYLTGSSSAAACYVNSPQNVSVSGGYLHLTLLKTAAPFTCSDPNGSFTTQYTAGMVSTYGLFDQTYGAFEVNAKLPQSTIQGLQETFWLYPQNLTYGAWPASGEIDFAEFYSEYPNLDVPYIHYNAATPDPAVTAYDCIINPTRFNTYGVVWSPDSLTVYYNGKVCLVDHPNPATPLSGNEPFDKPFMIALTQAIGGGTNAFVPGITQLPATTLVKFVRAWR